MKLIESSVSLIDIKNPFMKIEKVGRTCYKSTSAMTEETAKKFFNTLASRKHTAMIEHATFCFEVSEHCYHNLIGNKYFNYSTEELENGTERFLVSGNLRAIVESKDPILLSVLGELDPDLIYDDEVAYVDLPVKDNYCKLVDIDNIPDIQELAYKKHKYLSFHFICDRGVTHEMVRHRPASYAQESTRFCNYSTDKFGKSVTFIKPSTFDKWSDVAKAFFYGSIIEAEKNYLGMIEAGCTPQEARAVLPNALKTEIIMTANCEEFDHFFDLRSRGTTGAPHPDMKKVADKALILYEQNTKKFS